MGKFNQANRYHIKCRLLAFDSIIEFHWIFYVWLMVVCANAQYFDLNPLTITYLFQFCYRPWISMNCLLPSHIRVLHLSFFTFHFFFKIKSFRECWHVLITAKIRIPNKYIKWDTGNHGKIPSDPHWILNTEFWLKAKNLNVSQLIMWNM